jgi:hypothetical protein
VNAILSERTALRDDVAAPGEELGAYYIDRALVWKSKAHDAVTWLGWRCGE